MVRNILLTARIVFYYLKNSGVFMERNLANHISFELKNPSGPDNYAILNYAAKDDFD